MISVNGGPQNIESRRLWMRGDPSAFRRRTLLCSHADRENTPESAPQKGTNMTFKTATAALSLSLILAPAIAFAQASMVNGEVKKIDEAAGKITLKHGPIKNLGMDEGMTMVFRVQDPAMLKQVKVGDKVQFEAERATAGITVVRLQKAK